MKFCNTCGASASDDAIFCSNCGTSFVSQNQSSKQTEQNHQTARNNQVYRSVPEQKSGKGLKIALISIFSVLILVCGAIGGFLFYRHIKTEQFSKYLEDYEDKAATYVSLGEYKDEYEKNVNEAKRLISQSDFRKMPKQKTKMEKLWSDVDDMVSRVDKQKVLFDEIVDEMESGEKYFFGDMEDEYNQAKEDANAAITEYLAEEAEEKTAALSQVAQEIKEYDESQVDEYLDAVEKTTVSSSWLAF